MRYANISGIGSYLPSKLLTNYDLEQLVSTSDQWIMERTGIKQRHIANDEETSSSMGEHAARQALDDAQIDYNDLDLIIVATCTPDSFFPSTACLLQQRLGITRNIPAFDISAACAGFIYALQIAQQYIVNGTAQHVLITCSEVMSRTVDWQNRSTCILFGDGAGAVVLSNSERPGILDTNVYADGQYKDLLYLSNHLAGQQVKPMPQHLYMQGNEVFKLAVRALGDLVDRTLADNNMTKQDIDWLVPHQANIRIINAIAKRLDLPMERVILTIAEHGNTSAASIPLALHTGIQQGQIKRGDMLLCEAFGAGLAWGSVLIQY
ncbi:MAG: beta-ketoacyl-ACP synthase III [Legionellales bacterium]|nr:beta-ketoacyl-ACP synthase III [Legionellales bacterium]